MTPALGPAISDGERKRKREVEPPNDAKERGSQELEALPPDWGRYIQLAALPAYSQKLIQELFRIVCGEEETCAEDDTFLYREPGHEKSREQRAADCCRVREILASGADGVHPDLRWTYGETLLWCTLEYDHRHPPQMMAVVLEAGGTARAHSIPVVVRLGRLSCVPSCFAAGADPNLPNALDAERLLDSRWLEDSSEPEVAEKRALIAEYQRRRASLHSPRR